MLYIHCQAWFKLPSTLWSSIFNFSSIPKLHRFYKSPPSRGPSSKNRTSATTNPTQHEVEARYTTCWASSKFVFYSMDIRHQFLIYSQSRVLAKYIFIQESLFPNKPKTSPSCNPFPMKPKLDIIPIELHQNMHSILWTPNPIPDPHPTSLNYQIKQPRTYLPHVVPLPGMLTVKRRKASLLWMPLANIIYRTTGKLWPTSTLCMEKTDNQLRPLSFGQSIKITPLANEC